jgi:hypothetical protein
LIRKVWSPHSNHCIIDNNIPAIYCSMPPMDLKINKVCLAVHMIADGRY